MHKRFEYVKDNRSWFEYRDTGTPGVMECRDDCCKTWGPSVIYKTWDQVLTAFSDPSVWKEIDLSSTQMRVDLNDLGQSANWFWGCTAYYPALQAAVKHCDCGAVKAKTTHANWCSTNG